MNEDPRVRERNEWNGHIPKQALWIAWNEQTNYNVNLQQVKATKEATQKFGGSKIEQQTTLVIANMDCFSKQMISFARK